VAAIIPPIELPIAMARSGSPTAAAKASSASIWLSTASLSRHPVTFRVVPP
jgi:hypothetical protein